MAADDGCAKAALVEALKPFQERASEAEIRIAKLEALLYNQDGLNSGSEASSSAMKDLQSKLDSVSAECLTEKEKVFGQNCIELLIETIDQNAMYTIVCFSPDPTLEDRR
ncbi:unnamed protein product [Urochloa decumbens]|uniref:Uncharacterized protein n=1 Tax=Urochloa decumbens TaxID=240449 RepID=A0ABC9FZQ4_9POAL